MKTKILFANLLIIFLLCGCSSVINNQKSNAQEIQVSTNIVSVNKDTINHKVNFSVVDENEKGIEGAEILLIDFDGKLIDKIATDKNGKVIKDISVKIDKRFDSTLQDGLGSRGTITAIINKKGYINVILMEVPVSDASGENVFLKPLVVGGRNEPEVILANNHHLEIFSFFNKYSKYFNEK